MDKLLLSNDIIDFTETQELRENTEDIKMKFEKQLSLHFNCNLQKHRSITIAYSSRM